MEPLKDNLGWHIDDRMVHDALYYSMGFCIDPCLYALFSQFKMDSDKSINSSDIQQQSYKDEIERRVAEANEAVRKMSLEFPRLPEAIVSLCKIEPNNDTARQKAANCGGPNLTELCTRCGDLCPVRNEGKWRSANSVISSNLSSCSFKQLEIIRNPVVSNTLMVNNSNGPLITSFKGNSYLIPGNSSFILADVYDSVRHLVIAKKKFDVLILDPPWDNKSVKRKRSYRVESERFLYKIPFDSLLKDKGLVVMWITNKQKFQNFIINELFPSAGLKLVAKWHWSKITQLLELICQTKTNFKTSFETIFIADRITSDVLRTIPNGKVVVSVPNACHSRKPPLQVILNELLGTANELEYLELFARFLYPGTVSVGNEVLKFQHLSYFKRTD